MATKKKSGKKKSAGKKKPAARAKAVRQKKAKRATKTIIRGKKFRGSKLRRGETPFDELGPRKRRGLGEGSAGQSGDTQGISRTEDVDSESVEELLEEGQTLEAEAVSGVEDALDPDEGEVHTSEVPEDDVPGEDDDKD
jgi:hypothetical protein